MANDIMISTLTTVNSYWPAKFYQFNCKNLFMRTLINPESDEGRVLCLYRRKKTEEKEEEEEDAIRTITASSDLSP